MELTDIRLGDTVRLRNGETIVVDSKAEWYEDRDGRHEGPFVSPKAWGERYPLSDVTEIVACNARICAFCPEGITSTEPDVDFCRNCFYQGNGWERRLMPLILRLRLIPTVEDAQVWHTGGGCFNLAVTLHDGRLLAPSIGFEGEDGQIFPEPGFPEGPDDRWAMVVSEDESAWNEWDEDRLTIPQSLYTADELVAAVAEIAREGVPS